MNRGWRFFGLALLLIFGKGCGGCGEDTLTRRQFDSGGGETPYDAASDESADQPGDGSANPSGEDSAVPDAGALLPDANLFPDGEINDPTDGGLNDGAGLINCWQAVDCLQSNHCARTDNLCSNNCLDLATLYTRAQAWDVIDCANIQCANLSGLSWTLCAKNNCPDQLNVCASGSFSGNLDCVQTFACLQNNGCAPSDRACLSGCFLQANLNAFFQVLSLLDCAYSAGCYGRTTVAGRIACAQNNCPNEFNDCLLGSGSPLLDGGAQGG